MFSVVFEISFIHVCRPLSCQGRELNNFLNGTTMDRKELTLLKKWHVYLSNNCLIFSLLQSAGLY